MAKYWMSFTIIPNTPKKVNKTQIECRYYAVKSC